MRINLRLEHALIISLLIHGSILTLQFELPELDILKGLLGADSKREESSSISAVLTPLPGEVSASNPVPPPPPLESDSPKEKQTAETNAAQKNAAANFSAQAFKVALIAPQPIEVLPAPTPAVAVPVKPKVPKVRPAKQASLKPVELPVEAPPETCLLYTSPSPRDGLLSRMPSSA